MKFRHALCTFFLALVLAAQAFGQANSEYLPEPISARQVAQYADRLGLSAAQRQAADDLHLSYQHDCQVLREGEITELLNIRPAGYMTRAFYNKREALDKRIAALDNAFFDHLQTILTDVQSANVPRIRQERQRERWLSNGRIWNWQFPPVDLSRILFNLHPAPEDLKNAEEALLNYENALTIALAKVDKAVDRMHRQQ